MKGDAASISIVTDHSWYDCIKFYDPVGKQLPKEKIYMRYYLVLDIDVSPNLT